MKTNIYLTIIATTAALTAGALAQAPQTPSPGTTPTKDGSAAQKPNPDQPPTPGAGTGTRTPATGTNTAKGANDKPAQQGAGNTQPVEPAQSGEQKPVK